jgi:trehalose/maltose transport system substrate-binding protein
VSSLFWSAVHDVLSGNASGAEAFEILEADLADLKGDAWQ